MTSNKLEQEAKFWLGQPERLAQKLDLLGATLTQARVHEFNLRFDTPDHNLSRSLQALRLRQDTRARLTWKGAADPEQGISARAEIEVEVSDLPAARAILEALGFHVVVVYEKYRAAWQLGPLEVSLDEMPFGHFCEIEGPDEAAIHTAAGQLGLKWAVRSKLSYLAIFSALKQACALDMPDLTFASFQGQAFSLEAINLIQADE